MITQKHFFVSNFWVIRSAAELYRRTERLKNRKNSSLGIHDTQKKHWTSSLVFKIENIQILPQDLIFRSFKKLLNKIRLLKTKNFTRFPRKFHLFSLHSNSTQYIYEVHRSHIPGLIIDVGKKKQMKKIESENKIFASSFITSQLPLILRIFKSRRPEIKYPRFSLLSLIFWFFICAT